MSQWLHAVATGQIRLAQCAINHTIWPKLAYIVIYSPIEVICYTSRNGFNSILSVCEMNQEVQRTQKSTWPNWFHQCSLHTKSYSMASSWWMSLNMQPKSIMISALAECHSGPSSGQFWGLLNWSWASQLVCVQQVSMHVYGYLCDLYLNPLEGWHHEWFLVVFSWPCSPVVRVLAWE